MEKKRIWILGAPDPEMEAIEKLLKEAAEQVAYATLSGVRVRPDDAYKASGTSSEIPAGTTVYAVECGGPGVPAGALKVDHHHPGDPGHGRPAAEFLPAASLGQVVSELARKHAGMKYGPKGPFVPWFPGAGWARSSSPYGPCPKPKEGVELLHFYPAYEEGAGFPWDVWGVCIQTGPLLPEDDVHMDEVSQHRAGCVCPYHKDVMWWARIPTEWLFIAAADHNLTAAYRGEFPDVDPDKLMEWRLASRAAFQRRSVEEVSADVEIARDIVRIAPTIEIGGQPVADLRGRSVPELPEAAAREGIAFLATPPVRTGERQKVVLQVAGAALLAAWPEWAAANGLTDLYGGDPSRGFAGGYVA